MKQKTTTCLICKKALTSNQLKNRGLYCGYSCSGKSRKHTPELNERVREAVKKLWENQEYRQHMRNAHKWQKGDKSPRWKGGFPKCFDCDKVLSKRTAKRCNPCMGLYFSGANATNWKGGTTEASKLIRNSTKYQEWRKAVFDRDNYTCVICAKKGGDLQADHIKPFAIFLDLRFELSNGRTLCKPCHYATDTFGSGLTLQRRYYGA